MAAASLPHLEDLLSRLPGTVRRGHVPAVPERFPTGHPEIDDLLGGGFPRGRLSEIVGSGSAGATSLAQRLLAGVTTEERFAAWVDLADALDPTSASAAGVALHRLLWVRPPDLVSAFAATEILLGTGGFALVLLDTARPASGRDVAGRGRASRRGPGEKGRRMLAAPQTWLRLTRAAARTRTALVVLARARGAAGEGLAGAAAGVRLVLSPARAVWEGADGAPSLLEGLVTEVEVARDRSSRPGGSRRRRAHIRLD